MSKAKEFFEKLASDPKAQELFVNKEKPNTPEEMIKAYADAAKELGFDLTADEIAEFIKEKEQEIKSGTDIVAKAIKKLPDENLESVAGGGHEKCIDTFKDYENCWWTDGCDVVFNHYKDYLCHVYLACGKLASSGPPLL